MGGQKLTCQPFMEEVLTRIYAGTGGPRGGYAFFGNEPNDGVLAVAETRLADIPLQTVPSPRILRGLSVPGCLDSRFRGNDACGIPFRPE